MARSPTRVLEAIMTSRCGFGRGGVHGRFGEGNPEESFNDRRSDSGRIEGRPARRWRVEIMPCGFGRGALCDGRDEGGGWPPVFEGIVRNCFRATSARFVRTGLPASADGVRRSILDVKSGDRRRSGASTLGWRGVCGAVVRFAGRWWRVQPIGCAAAGVERWRSPRWGGCGVRPRLAWGGRSARPAASGGGPRLLPRDSRKGQGRTNSGIARTSRRFDGASWNERTPKMTCHPRHVEHRGSVVLLRRQVSRRC